MHSLRMMTQIAVVTLDNASNCDTMLDCVEELLQEKGISFDSEENRGR